VDSANTVSAFPRVKEETRIPAIEIPQKQTLSLPFANSPDLDNPALPKPQSRALLDRAALAGRYQQRCA